MILSLDIICGLIIPSVILAFLTELHVTHCFEGFKSLEIITPKSVSSVKDCKPSPFLEQVYAHCFDLYEAKAG